MASDDSPCSKLAVLRILTSACPANQSRSVMPRCGVRSSSNGNANPPVFLSLILLQPFHADRAHVTERRQADGAQSALAGEEWALALGAGHQSLLATE